MLRPDPFTRCADACDLFEAAHERVQDAFADVVAELRRLGAELTGDPIETDALGRERSQPRPSQGGTHA